MKVYEYLAAGLPVVATPLPALAERRRGRHRARRRGHRRAARRSARRRQPGAPRRALARRGVPLVGAAPRGDRRGDRRAMRDLLVTTHTPVLRSGQAVRTYGVARALAAHGGLTLLYARFGADEPDAAFRAIPGVELHEVVPSRGLQRACSPTERRACRACPTGSPAGLRASWREQAGRLAAEPRSRTGDRRRPDRRRRAGAPGAQAPGHLQRAQPRVRLPPRSRRRRRQRRARCAAFERRLLERAAESWMVSETDMAGARELCPQARLRYVPNVVDVAAIEPVSSLAPRAPGDLRRELRLRAQPQRPALPARGGLPAGLGGAARRAAGARRSRDSSDRRAQIPASRRSASSRTSRPPTPARACAVVPLLQGGGTPLKFIEALAYGLPVIATPRAGAGLRVRDGEDCLIAEGGEEFADGARAGSRDGAPELGRRGRELAADRYSIEALSQLLLA